MKSPQLILYLLLCLISCADASKFTDGEDCPDTQLVGKMVEDIVTVQSKVSFGGEQPSAFRSYRRLEAITADRYDLDELSYDYYVTLLDEDSLRTQTHKWVSWIAENGASLNSQWVDRAFETANDSLQENYTGNYSIESLRIQKWN